ncbi:MarC family protein [Pseudoruegeria sp. SK021]|uniref:MarC family protein n=1 Tax=Pseudoruegeria sp. SK021 TaxID=1933035 RepID=UPI000A2305C1|nr:MarC family protein [Pseudoruegeria sp. SK021]OSP53988.1 hypothetical protein BV911_14745 [Pseudoruegeria sp. SK021]
MIEHLRALAALSPKSDHLQAIATLVALVNPGVSAMIFINTGQGQSKASAVRAASLAMFTVLVILLTAALVGASILKLFGISLDAFTVTGGLVLMFIGFLMLRGPVAPSAPATSPDGGAGTGNLGKLILFAASPGTITGVITISAAQSPDKFPITAVVAVMVVLLVTWLLLVGLAMRGSSATRPGMARDMLSRYMGLIIVAMGVQFALTGYKAFMG